MSDYDPDDLFNASRMSLGDHLEELRAHLIRALLGLMVGTVLGFFVSQPVLEFIAGPVDREVQAFHQRRLDALEKRLTDGDPTLAGADAPRELAIEIPRAELAEAVGLPAPASGGWVSITARIRPLAWELAAARARHTALQKHGLAGLTMTEPFMVYFKVSLYCGLVLASPWIFYQLWAFVASGLYPHERKLVYLYLPLSIGLFLAGVALCELVVLPLGVSYLLSYYEWLGVEPEIRLSDWLSFALLMPLVFGAAFQTPLVMLLLDRIGLADAALYRRHRKLAFFLLTILAAVLTVTPDAVNMVALAAPLWALYELGIWLCVLAPRPAVIEEDEEEVAEVF